MCRCECRELNCTCLGLSLKGEARYDVLIQLSNFQVWSRRLKTLSTMPVAGDTERVYSASAHPMLGKVIRDKLLMSLLRYKKQELKRKGVLKSFYIPELVDSGQGGG